eukprot:3169095-Rhodomonas_salina.2
MSGRYHLLTRVLCSVRTDLGSDAVCPTWDSLAFWCGGRYLTAEEKDLVQICVLRFAKAQMPMHVRGCEEIWNSKYQSSGQGYLSHY